MEQQVNASAIQSVQSLDQFYAVEDPWGYESHPDDQRRVAELRSLMPPRRFRRALDLGCGNGFVTVTLPADSIVGIDISNAAIEWCRTRAARLPDTERFTFEARSIFDLGAFGEAAFDLVVITGVLYPQYVNRSMALINSLLDRVLAPGGFLISCHIDEWLGARLPFTMVDQSLYPYREYTHRLEVMIK